MVVDGTSEFVGSNSSAATKAFNKALQTPKIPVRLSAISVASNLLRAHLETGSLDSSYRTPDAEVYVAVALDRANSKVSAGENAGQNLEHVSVARAITRIGYIKAREALSQDVQIRVPGDDVRKLRLIAFLQEARQGRVLGATVAPVNAK
jgi:hypothetical protein